MAWYNNAYLNRKRITLKHTSVSGNQSSFPVYLGIQDAALKSVSNGGKVQNANGFDIIFTLGETALQWYEIERYDGVNGILNAWVSVASLSASADTVLYMYYNNTSAPNVQNASIWNGYSVVHHLQTLNDSTNNHINISNNGTTFQQAGKIAGSRNFNGTTSQYMTIPNNGALNPTTQFTFTAWINCGDLASNPRYICDKLNQYSMYCDGSGHLRFYFQQTGGYWWWCQTSVPGSGWHRVDMVYSGGTLNGYIDAVWQNSVVGGSANIASTSNPLYIGFTSGGSNGNAMNGWMDEISFSTTARSQGYITTSYNFENNSSACYTLAAEENAPTHVSIRNGVGRVKVIALATRNFRGRAKIYAPITLSNSVGRANIRSSSKHGMGRVFTGSSFIYGIDTFNRSNNATTWGNISYGNIPWNRVAGIGKQSIVNNTGFLKYGGNVKDTVMTMGSQAIVNGEIKAKMRLGSNSAEQIGVVFRYLDPNNYYKYSVGLTRDTSYLWSYKAGKYTTLLTMATPCTVNTWVWVKIRYYGSTISLKFWQDGQLEPTNWMWTKVDTALTAAGQYGVVGVPASASPGVSFDYVEVDPPQTKRRSTGRIVLKQAYPTIYNGVGRVNIINRTTTSLGMGRTDVDIAPKPSPTGVYVTVGSTITPILIDSLTLTEHINQRTTCSFTVRDNVVYLLQQEEAISVYTDGSLIFYGYVDTIQTNHLLPSSSRTHLITAKDLHYLADKNIYTGNEYKNWLGGDIACDFIDSTLTYEGVEGVYAKDTDRDAITFGQGILTNLDASSGALQLAPAGADVSILESTNADFSTGTFPGVNAIAINDSLMSRPYSGFMMSGSAIGGSNTATSGASNIYNYYKIWRGTSPTIASGDYLTWAVWVSTSSPEINGGVDFLCTDGTALRDSGAADQYSINVHPGTSLQGYAEDTWYNRTVHVPASFVGKQIGACLLALEGNTDGAYTFYATSMILHASDGTYKQTFIPNNTMQQISNVGYTNVIVQPVTVYSNTHVQRISPAYDISGVGVIKNSFISWDAITPVQPKGKGSYPAQVTIELSLDGGATWAVCTNHASIPNAIPGQTTAGLTATLRQTLRIGGPDPTLPSILNDCQFTIQSAPATTKVDTLVAESVGGHGTGTLNMLTNDSTGLYMQGAYKSWNDGDTTTGQTVWSTGTPVVSDFYGQLALRCDASSDCRVRFDFAGQHQNFVAELDVNMPASCEMGFVYRCSNWFNANDTYAYGVKITNTQIVLIKGSNSSVGSWSPIVSVSHTFTVGNWYRLKVSVYGNTHHVFMDDILYISTTDSTYPATGYLGARIYNGTASRQSGFFDNFGVQDINSPADFATGNRYAPSVSLTDPHPILDSYMSWDADEPTNTSLDIQVSLDNGANYTSCTNNAEIPGLLPGTLVAGMTVIIRTVMNSNNATVTPLLRGISWKVVGQYTATGHRISPPLDISRVGRAGNTSVAWDTNTPDGCTVAASVSTDGVTFLPVANGAEIPQIDGQANPQEEAFDDMTTFGTFTATSYTGGSAPTMTWNTTAQTNTIVGGATGVITWDTIDEVNMLIEATLNRTDNGGILARYRDGDNHNRLIIQDDDGIGNQAYLLVAYRALGNEGNYTPIPVDFVRGTYHTLQWELVDSDMNVSWDGVLVATLQNNSVTTSGKVAFYNDTGTAIWNDLVVRGYGDDVTGMRVWSRLDLSTTDPTATPSIDQLSVAVRSPNIAAGSQIPQTNFVQKTFAANLDDIAKQGNCWWKIGNTQADFMQFFLFDHEAQRAPWPLASVNGDILYAQPQVIHQAPKYRNRQYVTGAVDHVTVPETKVGDGITQSWSLDYPVDSIQSITINGFAATFGIKNVDTNKQFYYAIGSNTLAQEAASIPVLSGQLINIIYRGQVPYTAMQQSLSQQQQLAFMNKTTGIVAATESVNSLSKDAADALAQARITEYAILARDWNFSTTRAGLHPGQALLVFVPEMGIPSGNFFILEVKTTVKQQATDGSLWYIYDVHTSEGPDIGSWTKLFQLIS